MRHRPTTVAALALFVIVAGAAGALPTPEGPSPASDCTEESAEAASAEVCERDEDPVPERAVAESDAGPADAIAGYDQGSWYGWDYTVAGGEADAETDETGEVGAQAFAYCYRYYGDRGCNYGIVRAIAGTGSDTPVGTSYVDVGAFCWDFDPEENECSDLLAGRLAAYSQHGDAAETLVVGVQDHDRVAVCLTGYPVDEGCADQHLSELP